MTKIDVYKIDKDVPVPEPIDPVGNRVPIDSLDVGDSILFPLEERPKVQVYASRLKKEKNKEFTVRLINPNECRIWRIK